MNSYILFTFLLATQWQGLTASDTVRDDGNEVENEELIENVGRFLISTTTSISTVYLTTSATCTKTTSCASIAATVTQCRRRRTVEEIPHVLEDIQPTRTLEVEPTLAASLQGHNPSLSITELLSSSVVERNVEAVDIKGVDQCFRQRQGFPTITIIWTTSVTSSTLCLASTTTTKTYSVAGCYPSGATSSTCPSSG